MAQQLKKRKPLNDETKAKFKKSTRYMWLVCHHCKCEFELTEAAGAELVHGRNRHQRPILCFDCFIKTDGEEGID